MKFIDLFNRNKDTPVFQEKQRKFKAWCRLAKNNPWKYGVSFCKIGYYFEYMETAWTEGGTIWTTKDDSRYCGRYKEMIDFEK